ncbi:FliA/WhiG family RNA polymerase sigma factor [Altererythrobacter soli]|uniref:FliA/WhiG family RNA polymerase sigma factor n=1 Tax=Croceibacterium soli TaxID=1739690 RepID=A0A6I4USU9_9SPHN|nr:FliA/WhiG family RNA polymerase sigma factor [Croceibacterium soli]MXP41546.1 FliA/WhiG family RNA polymerase sigma factor [Croceibacterium soli]
MIQDHSHFSATKAYRGAVGDRVNRFLPMVRKLAWHLSGSGGPTVEVDDLVQAGLVALTECAQKHDGPSEDGFAAYAKLRVRGAMVDMLRSSSPDPRGARAKRKRIEQQQARLAAMLGREPSAAELAQALGMDVDELHRLRSGLAETRLSSIEECYSESDSAFAADEPDAENLLLQQEDREQLIAAIGSLPERHRLVIQLYFVEELNLAEIAAVLGVSVPRVHQLKASALEKVRAAIADDS